MKYHFKALGKGALKAIVVKIYCNDMLVTLVYDGRDKLLRNVAQCCCGDRCQLPNEKLSGCKDGIIDQENRRCCKEPQGAGRAGERQGSRVAGEERSTELTVRSNRQEAKCSERNWNEVTGSGQPGLEPWAGNLN